MKIKDYLKERKVFFFVLLAAVVFCGLIVWSSGGMLSGRAYYILEGLGGLCIVYITIDYFVMRGRIARIERFFSNGAADSEIFTYPLDAIYAAHAEKMAEEHRSFKIKAKRQQSDELDFITRWVHDIKVPISALYLLAENFSGDDAQKLEMQISFIEQHTQKALYHIKSNSFEDDFIISKTSTMKMVNSALKHYAVFFAQKKISLEMPKESFEVLTDEKWSGYIISQFLSNAVKHTPQGGSIAVKALEQDGRVLVCIRNTGQGIEPQYLEQVFSRGYTGGIQRSCSFSTGYGLYLSKKLAGRMGHEVFAASQPGEYAEFCLAFSKTANVTKM